MLSLPRSMVLAFVAFLFVRPAEAAVHQVPQDHRSIQLAIDFASDGDVVRVSAGVYYEDIDFKGKAIAVLGVDGPAATILEGRRPVVRFFSGEGSQSMLSGFTIKGGFDGGIICWDASPTIVDNWIVDNNWRGIQCIGNASPIIRGNRIQGNRSGHGGGIFCSGTGADPIIEANEFRDNTAAIGAAIYSAGGRPTIVGNTFHRHTSALGYAGVYVEDAPVGMVIRDNRLDTGQTALALLRCPSARIEGNTSRPGLFELVDCPDALLIGNAFSANAPNAIHWIRSSARVRLLNNSLFGPSVEPGLQVIGSDVTAVNTIFWNGQAAPIRLGQGATLTATHCLVGGGWPGAGNINAHPLHIGGPVADPHLRTGSPCVDAGTSVVQELTGIDVDGQARVLPGSPGAEPRVDIGADEMAIEHAARFGEIGAAAPDTPPGEVLFVNSSVGDTMREVRVGPGDWLSVLLSPPIAGPAHAPYVLYAFRGEPTIDTVSRQPGRLGWMTFGTPLSRDATGALDCIWNNLGFPDRLGRHHRPSEPAPHELFRIRADNLDPGTVFTLQGFMLDNASAAIADASVTNAIVIRVE